MARRFLALSLSAVLALSSAVGSLSAATVTDLKAELGSDIPVNVSDALSLVESSCGGGTGGEVCIQALEKLVEAAKTMGLTKQQVQAIVQYAIDEAGDQLADNPNLDVSNLRTAAGDVSNEYGTGETDIDGSAGGAG